MRKAFILSLLMGFTVAFTGKAQHIGRKEANALMEKMLVYLKVSDEKGFASLWSTQTSTLSNQAPFTLTELHEHYVELRTFLDTAIAQSLRPDETICSKLGKLEQKEFGADSRITVYYKYETGNRKGISLYAVKEKENWKFRAAPEYLMDRADRKP